MSKRPTIIVAEDDRAVRMVIRQALEEASYDVLPVASLSSMHQRVEMGDGDLLITDVLMPDGNGLDALAAVREVRPELPVIVISAQNTLATAVRAAEEGAFDYLPKPFDLDELRQKVVKALKTSASSIDGEAQDEDLAMIGRSSPMQELYRAMARVIQTTMTVLITGESGTGKELVARAIHDLGERADKPFVAVNMAALPRELIESELFGHEKGAFTGAVARVEGRFAQAEGGTLFLDEIGDMPMEVQTRLLRVLQQGEYTTVGGKRAKKADVRIVAATNQNLAEMIGLGQFREDLFYRLNVVPIRVPPLRDRLDDLPDLINHFTRTIQKQGLELKTIDELAMERLRRYRWPGNVRELENLMRRLAVLYPEQMIGPEVIEQELEQWQAPKLIGQPMSVPGNLEEATEHFLGKYFAAHGDGLPPRGLHERILREVERPLISMTLAATRGNQIKAAETLGLNRNTLRKKIKDLGIKVVRGKANP